MRYRGNKVCQTKNITPSPTLLSGEGVTMTNINFYQFIYGKMPNISKKCIKENSSHSR